MMANNGKDLQTQDATKQEVQVAEGTERTRPYKAYVPRVDIYETDESLVILADMPGVSKDAIDITLEKNVLSLRGRVDYAQPEGYSLAYAEYEVGDYERNFTLSDGIDSEKIEASLKDGVLRLDLPKAGPAKTRKISVKAA